MTMAFYKLMWRCGICGAKEELHPDPDGWLPPEHCDVIMHLMEGALLPHQPETLLSGIASNMRDVENQKQQGANHSRKDKT